MEKSILEKNLEELARYDYELAQSIADISDYSYNFELKETTCGDLNLYLDNIPLHDEVDAIYEAEEVVKRTNYTDDKNSIHVIFGFGIGHLFQAMAKSVSGKIVVYEPNIEILRAAFEFVDFSEELKKTTIMIIDKEEKFEVAMGKLFFLKGEMTLSFLNSYGKLYPETVISLSKKLSMLRSIYTNAYQEIQKQSGWWTICKLANLFNIYENEELEALLGKFKNKPAIVVSAGPSLSDNLEYIKKYRNNIVVFCVGTALKTLLKNDIRPDFVSMIESRYCLTQISDIDLSDINFILYPTIFSPVYDFKPDRVFNYYPDNLITTEWLQGLTGVDAKKYKNRGTVSISALDSAYLLGCNPIILVGQDLAYRNGQCYASNSPYNISYKEVSPGKYELFVEDFDKYFETVDKAQVEDSIRRMKETLKENSKNLCFTKGQNGNNLLTSSAYAMFVEHLENLASEIGNSCKLFNTLSGAAQINGFENISLEEFLKKYASEKICVEEIIKPALKDFVSLKDKEEFMKEIDFLLQFFNECLVLFKKGGIEFKKLKNLYQRSKLLTPEIKNIMSKISDIYKNIITNYIVKNRVAFSLLIREYYMVNEFLKEGNDYSNKERMNNLLEILQEFFSSGEKWLNYAIEYLDKSKELFNESSASTSK